MIFITNLWFVAAGFFIQEIRGASLFLSVNFKEPEAVRALTCTLLKEDFGLTIQIPLERLIPTVPLRLNYIHWVEDLIDGQKQPRRGIDIGTAVVPSFVCWTWAPPFHSNAKCQFVLQAGADPSRHPQCSQHLQAHSCHSLFAILPL